MNEAHRPITLLAALALGEVTQADCFAGLYIEEQEL